MKLAPVLILATLLTASSAFGQGTFGTVFLNNHDVGGAGIFLGYSPAPAGTIVEILAGPNATSLTPIASTRPGNPTSYTITIADMNANGPNTGSFFDYGFGEVKGVTPGGTAAFVGRAWLGAPTYDAATVRGAVSWTQTIGTEIRPLPAPAILKFPGLAIYEGAIWLNNYDVNQPIFFFDGTTVQLAPFLTRVQVLGRPVGSNREFQVLTNHGGAGSTFFTGQGQDAGLFDAGYGVVPGVPQFGPAEVVVRAWRGANTWESALTNMQAFVGQSSIFTNRTGQSSPFPGLPTPAILDMPSFTIYPFPQACGLVPFVGSRPLCMGVSANGQALEFTWPDLGTNYVYTLEFTPSLTATNWTPVPDATWPARTNQFTLPNPPVARSFYRVKAQAVQ